MPDERFALREGIDTDWLATLQRDDPVRHAYARWDLERAPERTRFVTLLDRDRPTGYLLVWYGLPAGPVVHWVDAPATDDYLARGLPDRPLLAIVPSPRSALLGRLRGPVVGAPVQILARPPSRATGAPAEPSVRPLAPRDGPALERVIADDRSLVTEAYRRVDLAREEVWGRFEAERLVGAARVAVHLPNVWVVGSVFVGSDARGRGHAYALLEALTQRANAEGATVTLGVREDNPGARRLYDRLGFRLHERKIWMDCGTGVV